MRYRGALIRALVVGKRNSLQIKPGSLRREDAEHRARSWYDFCDNVEKQLGPGFVPGLLRDVRVGWLIVETTNR